MKTMRIFCILATLLALVFCVGIYSSAAEDEVPEGYVGIYTKDDLFAVHFDTSTNYILMNDIVFDASDFSDDYNDGNGWIPIEDFVGTFDGNNHKISNLTIKGDVSYAGLFKTLSERSTVKNLFLENVNIDVTGDYVGAICGNVQTKSYLPSPHITNCTVTGKVSGGNYVGGICGHYDIFTYDKVCSIDKSCNAATVTGKNYVGGIFGYYFGYSEYLGYAGGRDGKGYMSECVNTGSISGDNCVGGLIGRTHLPYHSGTYGSGRGYLYLTDSFNCGAVSCASYGGGLVGEAYYSYTSNQLSVSNCYNAGTVTSSTNTNFGAIYGGGGMTSSQIFYLNRSVTEPTTTVGTSVTADKLKITDLGSYWTIQGCERYSYPELISVHPVFQISGEAEIVGEGVYGSTLTVNTDGVSPDVDALSVQWFVGGALAGDGSEYTVKAEDIGKEIYALLSIDDECIRGSLKSTTLTAKRAHQTATPITAAVKSKTDTSIELYTIDNQEYSLDGVRWCTDGIFTDLTPNTVYVIYTRIAENETHQASAVNSDAIALTYREIMTVTRPIYSDDKQFAHESIGYYNLEVTEVVCDVDGITLVKLRVPTGYDTSCVELYRISEVDNLVENVEFTVSDGYVCFDNIGTNKYAVVAAHQHKSSETLHKPESPTCTAQGSDWYITCSECDYSSYAAIAPLGHSEVYHEAKAPTPTEVGWNEYVTCERCDYSTYVELPTKEHLPASPKVEGRVEPTCSTDGYYYNVTYCADCGAEMARELVILEKSGHTPDSVVFEDHHIPTCTMEGYYYFVVYCSVCGDECSREIVITDRLGHTPSDTVTVNGVDPTCTLDGYYFNVVYCSECKCELSREMIVVRRCGHTPEKVSVTDRHDPTCTVDGYYYLVVSCSICDTECHRELVITEKLGHTSSEAVKFSGSEPTCTLDGYYYNVVYCSECGYELSREMVVIDRLYHEFKTYISDANASCTADGTKTACCDRSCGETHTVIDSGSALGHDWEDATTESPKTCKTCGATDGDKLDLNTDESATEGDHSKCEAGGFKRFWRAIFNFFRRIIGLPKKCVCGEKL